MCYERHNDDHQDCITLLNKYIIKLHANKTETVVVKSAGSVDAMGRCYLHTDMRSHESSTLQGFIVH